MLIVTLTSIPGRLPGLGSTIYSLLNQTVKPDRIYLNIPERYHRFPEQTFTLPDFPGVTVRRCQDYGPATKLIPTLLDDEIQPDDYIVVVDDDRVYQSNLIEKLVAAATILPDCAITGTGWDVKWATCGLVVVKHINRSNFIPADLQQGTFKQLLGGCCGFLIRKSFLSTGAITPVPWQELTPSHPAFYVDDIYFSGLLTANQVPIWCPETISEAVRTVNDHVAGLYDHQTNGQVRDRKNYEAVCYCQDKYGIWVNQTVRSD